MKHFVHRRMEQKGNFLGLLRETWYGYYRRHCQNMSRRKATYNAMQERKSRLCPLNDPEQSWLLQAEIFIYKPNNFRNYLN